MLSRPTATVLASAAAFLFAAMLLLSPPSGGATGDVGPSQFFDPCGSTTVSTTAPDTPSDISGSLGTGLRDACLFFDSPPITLEEKQRSNFGGVINFTPTEWGVANDADIPDGTLVGTLDSEAVFGLFNNTCRTEIFVQFDLLDATTDVTSKIDAKPSGEPDRLSPMAEDLNGNGVPDGAERWPSYLDELVQDIPPSQLRARLFGANSTALPGLTTIRNFLIFEPGTQVAPDLIATDPRLGYPSVMVLDDPTVASSNQDPINDFCAPLAERMTLLGTAESGEAFRTTPTGDGAYPFVTFTTSQRDADDDGIENSLDPCPYTPDPDWDPRGENVQDSGDTDGDLLPDSCDPFPTVKSCCSFPFLPDEDLDGWMNGADNCPLDANLSQADGDSDDIGDACDQNPTVPDGDLIFVCIVSVVTVGTGGTPAYDPQTLTPCDPTAPLATGQVTWADNNCKDGVTPVDSLLALRFDAGLSANTNECPPMGASIDVLLASPHIWGDVDCKDSVTPVDALKILRHDGALSVSQEEGCPEMESSVAIVEKPVPLVPPGRPLSSISCGACPPAASAPALPLTALP